jgi:hypothetical protein
LDLDPDSLTVANHIERELKLNSAALAEEYFYRSLPLCVIDAVFSIGVRYSGTRRVVARYCEYTKQERIRPGETLRPISEQESMSTFCDRPEQADPSMMAERVYGSRQRTSTKNGILKAEAAGRLVRTLRSRGIEYFQDVPRVVDSARFEADIRSIPGQGSGISFQYFWMLAGSENFIKPDKMVLRFLQSALSRPVAVREANPLMRGACAHLVGRYPQLSPRLFDHEVWKHQRALKPSSHEQATFEEKK